MSFYVILFAFLVHVVLYIDIYFADSAFDFIVYLVGTAGATYFLRKAYAFTYQQRFEALMESRRGTVTVATTGSRQARDELLEEQKRNTSLETVFDSIFFINKIFIASFLGTAYLFKNALVPVAFLLASVGSSAAIEFFRRVD